MWAHTYGKVELSCCANWGLKRTVRDSKLKFSLRAIEAVLEHYYMDDYSSEEAISVLVEVILLVKLGRFNLTKLFSNISEIDK